MARLGNTIVAVEEDKDLADIATKNLVELGVDNAAIMISPLTEGYKKQSPYNVIVISGSVVNVPDNFIQQLAEGGRIVTVVNKYDSLGKGVLMTKYGSSISSEEIFDAWTPFLPGFGHSPKFNF